MTLTPKQLEAIERAKDRVAESALSFTRTYFDEEFTFKFLPTMNQPALEIIANVQSSSGANVMEQFGWLVKFMDVMAAGETGELIGSLATAGIMDMNDLVELQQEVISAISGRPTLRSSSSPDGSPSVGSPSTASAPPVESTQPVSPLIGS